MPATDDDFLKAAVEAAHEAGEILQSWVQRFTVSEKSRANLVTEADFASQEAIFRHLHGLFPEHNFLGEETMETRQTDSPYRWVVDPLDGTSNYVHGFPYYAVSIALEHAGELRVGVIFDPNRNETFTAVSGRGAKVNGRSLRPSGIVTASEAMVVASLPVAAQPDDPAVKRLLTVMPHVQTVQRTGSAALNLAYVAAGRIEAFWSSSLQPWDVAAGALIVTEAGGVVSRMNGGPLDLAIPDVLASNGPALHAELTKLLT